mmetsp:Transcript_19740/g.58785  ORF Transcript_19740/g.58785 Transcript_19740/m.58785 type:complete len:201 (-) Transcript_19740:52-654(-)
MVRTALGLKSSPSLPAWPGRWSCTRCPASGPDVNTLFGSFGREVMSITSAAASMHCCGDPVTTTSRRSSGSPGTRSRSNMCTPAPIRADMSLKTEPPGPMSAPHRPLGTIRSCRILPWDRSRCRKLVDLACGPSRPWCGQPSWRILNSKPVAGSTPVVISGTPAAGAGGGAGDRPRERERCESRPRRGDGDRPRGISAVC